MLIEGYEDDPVVDGAELLALPGFWMAYLEWLCKSEGRRDELLAERFGVSRADCYAAEEALMSEETWPAFRIPFAGGHSAVVLYANHDEDPGIEYFVTHAGWGRHGYLATIDGHFAGPGLAWRELVHIARTPDQEAPGIQDPHARLLLLLPALGDRDTPEEAVDLVAGALLRAKVPAGETRLLAGRMLHHPMFEAAGWVLPDDGILVCDAQHSPRCGIRLAQGITDEQSDMLARAIGTAEPVS